MNPLEEMKKTAKGAGIIFSWLGAGGKPVHRERAEVRARACIKCPENVSGNWLDRLVKVEAADLIREYLEVKNAVQLKVTVDDQLGFCKKCGCVNALKVHVPIEHVKEGTTPEDLSTYPDACWIKKEAA